MRAVGLTATEFGPTGYLAEDPGQRAAQLVEYGLSAAGGFVPVVLHEPGGMETVDQALDAFGSRHPEALGYPVLVLAAATGQEGYDTRPELDASGWSALLANLDRAAARAAERGFTATLHPHVGTMVEGPDEVHRVLDGSGIPLPRLVRARAGHDTGRPAPGRRSDTGRAGKPVLPPWPVRRAAVSYDVAAAVDAACA